MLPSGPDPGGGLRMLTPVYGAFMPEAFGGKLGGAERPGGGPFAVENPPGDMAEMPLIMFAPDGPNGVGGLVLLPG